LQCGAEELAVDGGRDTAGRGCTQAGETVAVRIARQRAAPALRGHRQQAARGQLNDGLIAPLGACLKALRVVLARLHRVKLGAAGHRAATLTDEPLHDGIKLQGFILRRGGRHLQKDVGYAKHLQKRIPRVHGEVLGANQEHGGQVNRLRLAYNHRGGAGSSPAASAYSLFF